MLNNEHKEPKICKNVNIQNTIQTITNGFDKIWQGVRPGLQTYLKKS